jgi:hypothetical protein
VAAKALCLLASTAWTLGCIRDALAAIIAAAMACDLRRAIEQTHGARCGQQGQGCVPRRGAEWGSR